MKNYGYKADLRGIRQMLEQVADHIEGHQLPPEQAAQQVRLVAGSLNQKSPGRPSGSRTSSLTPGIRQAKDFLYLTAISNTKPAQAARLVAEKYGVTDSAVFKAAKRHESRLVEEAKQETNEARWRLAETVKSMYPDTFEKLLDELRSGAEAAINKIAAAHGPIVAQKLSDRMLEFERDVTVMASEYIVALHKRNRGNTADS